MMCLASLVSCFFISFFLSFEITYFVTRIVRFKKKSRKSVLVKPEVTYHPFVVSEYLSRIEQEYAKILQEREDKEIYTITLWICLDGLRMNDDGMFEWITKKEKKENNITPIQKDRLEQYIQQCCCTQSQPLPFGYSATSICQTINPISYQICRPQYPYYHYSLPQYQRFYPFTDQTQTIENQIREQTQQLGQNIKTLRMQLLQQEMNTQNIKYYSKFP